MDGLESQGRVLVTKCPNTCHHGHNNALVRAVVLDQVAECLDDGSELDVGVLSQQRARLLYKHMEHLECAALGCQL